MSKTVAKSAQIDDLNLLRLFVAVADEGGFSAAARARGLQRSSVSRGVSALEQALGVQLFNRSTRSVSLTSAGLTLYESTASKLKALERSVNALPERRAEPSGKLKITASQDFGSILLPRILPGFLERYPKIELDVRVTNRVVDLVAEGFDAAIRPGPLPDSQLRGRKFLEVRLSVYAAPRYVMSAGAPKNFDDAAQKHTWVAGPGPFTPKARLRVLGDDMLFVHGCALQGLGLCVLPDFLASDDVAAGRLVRLMAVETKPVYFYLVRPEQTQSSVKLDAFSEYLLENMQRVA